MSGARIIFPNFRDEQSDSRYPFADTASLRDATGVLNIPRAGFIDAVIYAIGRDLKARLARVIVTNDTVSLVIVNSGNKELARGVYNQLTPPATGYIPLYDNYARPAGLFILTQNTMAVMAGWGVGTHTFTASAAEFVSTVVIPAQEECLRAVSNDDQFFTGDVWIIGGNGVVVREDEENVVRIDITGEPLFKRILCGDGDIPFNPPNTLRTINGCGPDTYGNFTLTVVGHTVDDPVLRIYPHGGVLHITAVGGGVS